MAESVRLVAGLYDVTVVSEAIEQRRRHLGIAEDTDPLFEGQVRRDHHAGVLIEFRQKMEQQGAPGLAERQIPVPNAHAIQQASLAFGRPLDPR